ncbi:hypothetical protein [Microbacterium sp. J1-1]|uniref:hypothetical protein n=1 Tax=Microbacterium sp. J1-1 TaxID=2992441 RepID=UPI0021155738|nr:hypothetical protein [Microbacterium sp. J1-1]UUE19329.1 hypothetical protein LRQ07_10960 [Microbacterium sp. J1-1]
MGGPRKAQAPKVTTTPAPETAPDEVDASGDAVDTVVIVMNIAITGTVDGESWPAPGGEITLPTAEAERYVRLGYARFPEK